MSWIQVAITTTQQVATRIEDLLLELGAVSVTLKDAEDKPILEPAPGEIRVWENTIVTGLFDAHADSKRLRTRLEQQLDVAPDRIRIETLADQDWSRAWMDHYHAMQFGSRLWVCPWHEPPPDANAVNLRLDPGLAFGTGTHPTTALCLRWLDGHINSQEKLLDFGCGSGILAVAALLLGVAHADGVDIDDQALLASRDNASANGVEARLDLYTASEFAKRSANQNSYDIVVANILSGPLVELAAQLANYVRPGGDIVLSGIVREQAETVSSADNQFFVMDSAQLEEDWVLLHGCRRN